MLRLVLLLAVFSLVRAQTTNVEQCVIHQGALPVNTYVEGCLNPPCFVEPGGDAVLHLIFNAPHLITSMETLVTVEVPGLGVLQFPLEEYAVTCNFLTNSYCPILPGEVLQYSLRLNIPAIISSITVMIEFYVVDEHKNTVMCLRVPVTVP
ncbi:unnamed protein product [Arctia plantaginis]|uniref:MD-2-related lipid-recognition domain-containing protein n=1 Tax=Arctia plantaginis TaxID=874455 RepID=A0A8S1AKT8_ARCPL|nr:unnamed protein product [Arctia plantaginis]